MATRTTLLNAVTGTPTVTAFNSGSRNVLQITSTGAFSATLSASIVDNLTFTTVLTASANDFYIFNEMTDATFKLVVTSNGGTLSAALS